MSDKKRIADLEADLAACRQKLEMYEQSPLKDGYLSILRQVNTWNKDLHDEPTSLKYNPDTGDADQKAFEKAHKYITSIDTIYEKLAYLRRNMSPEIAKQVEQAEKNEKAASKDRSLAL